MPDVYCVSTAGAGLGGLSGLQNHPFFAGIDWNGLLDQDAPAFVPPEPRDCHISGFDWDFNSLAAAKAVEYTYEPTESPEHDRDESAEALYCRDSVRQASSACKQSDASLARSENQGDIRSGCVGKDKVHDVRRSITDQLEKMTFTEHKPAQNAQAAGLEGPSALPGNVLEFA